MAGNKFVNVIINARDRATEKIKSLTGSLNAMKILVAGALLVALRKITQMFGKLTTAAGIQEDAVAALTQQLKNNGEASQENIDILTRHAAALQKLTKFGDEATIQGQTSLLTYGLTVKQVKELTSVMQDFTAGSPQIRDMATAARIMGLAFKGDTALLKRYGLVIDTAGTSQEKFQRTIEAINKAFGGAAAAQAKTYTGNVQQLSNAWGDLLEVLGAFFTKNTALISLINKTKDAIVSLTGWMDKKRKAEEEELKVIADYTGLTIQQAKALERLNKAHKLLELGRQLRLANEQLERSQGLWDKQNERLKKSNELMAGGVKQTMEGSVLEEKLFNARQKVLILEEEISQFREKYAEGLKTAFALSKKETDGRIDGLNAVSEKTKEALEKEKRVREARNNLIRQQAKAEGALVQAIIDAQIAAVEKASERYRETLAEEDAAIVASLNKRLQNSIEFAQRELAIKKSLMERVNKASEEAAREELEQETMGFVERAILVDEYNKEIEKLKESLVDVSTAEGLQNLINEFDRLKRITKETTVGEDLKEGFTDIRALIKQTLTELSGAELKLKVDFDELTGLATKAGKKAGEEWRRAFEEAAKGIKTEQLVPDRYYGQGGGF